EGSPLLSQKQWMKQLGKQGFERTSTYNTGDELESALDLIVSYNDGVADPVNNSYQNAILTDHSGSSVMTKAPAESAAAATGLQPAQLSLEFIESVVKESFYYALGITESNLDPHKPFKDYGIDSITGINVITTLNERLGIQLKAIVLFDYITITDLSGYIYNEYRDQIHMGMAAPTTSELEPEDTLRNVLHQLQQGAKSIEEVNAYLERII
ncbi:acyl carrier protein, partial [Paenibacillus sp. S150]|uniref:acyl carrier protein n=1 Tax=Paenibacillus sp. S150 TaxID=2749826 RepID=UPI001C5783F8